MLSIALAQRLREAGLGWKPAPGDRFVLPDREMDDEVFVLSDMTIELHEMPEGGEVIGFNGTTEWALDDVQKSEALWLPREDQLRELLGGTFVRLERDGEGYRLRVLVGGGEIEVRTGNVEDAYGEALLRLVTYASADG